MTLALTDWVALLLTTFLSSGGAVWLVIRWQFKVLSDRIGDVDKKVNRAHRRIDAIYQTKGN